MAREIPDALKRVEHYTTAGNGAPGFVQCLQTDLRGIEATIQKVLAATAAHEPGCEARIEQFKLSCYYNTAATESRWEVEGFHRDGGVSSAFGRTLAEAVEAWPNRHPSPPDISQESR